MSVKLGNVKSVPKLAPGGSPQGSILGNYLFCSTTNHLTENAYQPRQQDVSFEEIDRDQDITYEDEENNAGEVGIIGQRVGPYAPAENTQDHPTSSTYNESALDESISFYRQQQRYEFDTTYESEDNISCNQSVIDRVIGVPLGWHDKSPDIFIYIDDANAVEKVRIPGSVVTISQNQQQTRIHAQKSEYIFNAVTTRVANIGMRVNAKKNSIALYFS